MRQHHVSKELVRLFGSGSRARILALFFGRPHESLYQREIVYETGLSLQTIQRELTNLVELGILRRHDLHQKAYYQISHGSDFFKPLKEIFASSS